MTFQCHAMLTNVYCQLSLRVSSASSHSFDCISLKAVTNHSRFKQQKREWYLVEWGTRYLTLAQTILWCCYAYITLHCFFWLAYKMLFIWPANKNQLERWSSLVSYHGGRCEKKLSLKKKTQASKGFETLLLDTTWAQPTEIRCQRGTLERLLLSRVILILHG